jgi:8-amino-7-oxononanoate synthase
VAAHRTVIDWLVQSARAYIYTTAAPPAMAHTLRVSLQLIRGGEGDRRRGELAARVAELRKGLAAALPQAPDGSAVAVGWQLADSFTAIQPLIVGGSAEALAASAALEAQGLWVPAIRPPTVPAGRARLRITLSASHTAADVDRLVGVLAVAARAAGAVA